MQESMSQAEQVDEAEEDRKFRINFDLNALHRLLQDYDPGDDYCPVERGGLALNDGPRLRMALRQLK